MILFACSSTTVGTGGEDTGDDDDSGAQVDGGHDSGTVVARDAAADGGTSIRRDSGGADGGVTLSDATCEPASSVSPTSLVYVPPLRQSVCSSSQINEYVAACHPTDGGATDDCDTFETAALNNDCISCLETQVDAGAWGALAYDQQSGEEYINVGGCFVTVSDAGDALGCAKTAASADLCELAACDVSCTEHTAGAFVDCTTAADNDVCENYSNDYDTCLDEDLDNDASSLCVGAGFNNTLTLVATVLCGNGQ
jgi:hypothetical protein